MIARSTSDAYRKRIGWTLTPLATIEVGLITAGACVLALGAVAKLGVDGFRWRAVAASELTVATLALLLPGWGGGAMLAVAFLAFAAVHVRAWRLRRSGCGCFGAGPEADLAPPHARRAGLTAASAVAMGAVAAAGPPAPVALVARHHVTGLIAVGLGAAGAAGWRRGFSVPARERQGPSAGERLLNASASFLERRVSRRTALERVALVGSALAVAPLRYLLYPVSALAAIDPGSCGGGLCTDGYTAFCCEINGGSNTCPPGTFPGGWWVCTSYHGSLLCSAQGVRYYVDCNRVPGAYWPGGCRCANDSCANRREACNVFRYGQCNTQVGGVTEVVCRMVVCENPGSIPGLNCSSSVAVDDAVCGHEAYCLQPEAIELPGAGGL
jgi:hypothetical protein